MYLDLSVEWVNTYKQWFYTLFNNKVNYYFPLNDRHFLATRYEPSSQDERPIHQIVSTYELEYDTPVHYVELVDSPTHLVQLQTINQWLQDTYHLHLCLRKTDLADIVAFITRVHALIKASPPTVPVDDLLRFSVTVTPNHTVSIVPPDALVTYIRSFEGRALGKDRSLDKVLKENMSKRLDVVLDGMVLGHLVEDMVVDRLITYYLDHTKYCDTDAMIQYALPTTYKDIKQSPMLVISTDGRLATLLGVVSDHTLRVLAIPGQHFTLSEDTMTTMHCWRETLSIRIAFDSRSPSYHCVSIMPKMIYYLPYEGATT